MSDQIESVGTEGHCDNAVSENEFLATDVMGWENRNGVLVDEYHKPRGLFSEFTPRNSIKQAMELLGKFAITRIYSDFGIYVVNIVELNGNVKTIHESLSESLTVAIVNAVLKAKGFSNE